MIFQGFSSYYLGPESRIIKRDNGGSWTFDGTHVNSLSPNCFRNNLTSGISTLGSQFAIGTFGCVGGQISNNYTICSNDDVPAFVSISLPMGGNNNFTYIWQYKQILQLFPEMQIGIIFHFPTHSAYDYGSLSTTTRFVRQATATGCGSPVYSNVLLITVNPKPVSGTIYHKTNH